MPYALIFDFGGVIVKTATQAPRHAWDRRLGLALATVESIVHGSDSWRDAQLGRISHEEHWRYVANRLGIDHDQIDRLEADYFSADVVDSNIVSLIERQRRRGQRVALLSNDSPALARKLAHLGLDGLFDPVVISGRIGHMKPAPASYLHILRLMNLAPQDAVFIDDMPANAAGARTIGMIAVDYSAELDLEVVLSPYLT